MRIPGAVTALALLLGVGRPADAQRNEHSVELFSTVEVVGGLTPLRAYGRTYLTPHGGARLDGGIQGEQAAFGFGFRYWEAARTHGVGTLGGDFFALGEWRPRPDSRTTLRATAGFALESVTSPDAALQVNAERDNIFGWSVGVGREVVAPFGSLVLLSLDLVVPPGNGGVDGRRAPVLELGVGFRSRFFQPIRIPSRAPR